MLPIQLFAPYKPEDLNKRQNYIYIGHVGIQITEIPYTNECCIQFQVHNYLKNEPVSIPNYGTKALSFVMQKNFLSYYTGTLTFSVLSLVTTFVLTYVTSSFFLSS